MKCNLQSFFSRKLHWFLLQVSYCPVPVLSIFYDAVYYSFIWVAIWPTYMFRYSTIAALKRTLLLITLTPFTITFPLYLWIYKQPKNGFFFNSIFLKTKHKYQIDLYHISESWNFIFKPNTLVNKHYYHDFQFTFIAHFLFIRSIFQSIYLAK